MIFSILKYTKSDGTLGFNVLRINGDEIVTLGLGDQDPEYIAWVAEGNTAEEWQPDAVEPETTQPDMEEEI